jgi:hypothetical protein
MTTIGTTSRPAYVYDADTDTWVPIGVGPHTHDEYVDKVLFDNKGDILVGTGEDTLGKLAVGEDGQFLVVDLDEPTGLTWRTLNANIDVSATAPSGPTSGSVWFNSSEGTAYIYYDSYWVPLSPAQVGPQGDAGVFVSATAPLNTDVIWVDTDEEPDVPVPAGGTNGQVLTKISSTDYDTQWSSPNLRTFTDSAARAAAIPLPTEGIVTYLNDVDRLDIHNGTAHVPAISTGAWTLYTPTFTGLTLGNGSLVAKYALVGKTLFFSVVFALGSTSAVGTSPTFGFPSGISSSTGNNGPLGTGTTNSIGGTRYPFWVFLSGGVINPRVLNSSGTYLTHGAITATVPFTWATGHSMLLSGQTEID